MPDRQQSTGSDDSIHIALPGGLRMYGRRWGMPDRPDRVGSVLLLHGLGDDHTAFPDAFAVELARTMEVLAPDLLGFGRSPAPARFDHTLEAHAAAMEAAIATLRPPTLLIGHSLGGAIATRIAARAAGRDELASDPITIAGLVSVEGNLTAADCFLSRRAILAADRGKFERWWSLLPGVLEARDTVPRYREVLRRTAAEVYLRAARSLYAETVDGALADAFNAVRTPRLFAHGGAVAAETLALIGASGVETAAFPDAPHWVVEHDPTGFAACITDWIERLHLFGVS